MSITKICYLCNSQEISIKPGSVRDNKELSILECDTCSLVFLSSFDHINNAGYEEGRMHDDDLGDGRALEIDELIAISTNDDNRRFEHLNAAVSDKNILDFGCGIGGFIKRAKTKARLVHGIELEKRFKKYFKENGLIVFNDISKVENNKYDIITLFHVLEHIPEPRKLLQKLSNMLSKDGLIIIEVPNVNDALITLYRSVVFQNFIYWSPHLFYFTDKTLEKLVLQAGMKINYCKQFNRYPLSNHLYWLAFEKPGGHEIFQSFNDEKLNQLYSNKLADLGKGDTILLECENL